MSQTSQRREINVDDSYESKKKRLHPRPDDDEPIMPTTTKKLVSGSKTISKSKASTNKKHEVTFSEGVEEIPVNITDKENVLLATTPMKSNSPSKTSLRSVKEHIKTPFSKVKDNSQENGTQSKTNSAAKMSNQPNFNTDSINKSGKKSRNATPTKSAMKKDAFSANKKSPLVKIKEEYLELVEVESNEVKKDENAEVKENVESSNIEVEHFEAIKEDEPCVEVPQVQDEEIPLTSPEVNELASINQEEAKTDSLHIQENQEDEKCAPAEEI